MSTQVSLRVGVHSCVCARACACGVPRLATGIFLDGSASLFFEAGFLSQTRSSKTWLISLAGSPTSTSKAGITGGYHTSSVFARVLDLQTLVFLLLQQALTSEPAPSPAPSHPNDASFHFTMAHCLVFLKIRMTYSTVVTLICSVGFFPPL